MPCTADFWVRRPPACEHMKRDVELGLGIPAHSGQQSPSSSAGQPWSPRNPLPWPCQWPSWCVYSMGTWPFAQSALTTPGKMALQSGHLRDPPKHRPGITEGEGGRFLFHFFFLGCAGTSLLRAGFLSGGEQWAHCGAWASRCGGLSCCRAQALGSGALVSHRLSSSGSQALEHGLSSCGTQAL